MLKYLFLLTAVTYVSCTTIPPGSLASLAGGNVNHADEEKVPIEIISQDQQVNEEEGTFNWSYETSDGTKVQQTGEVDPLNKEHVKSIEGSYSYLDPEGKTHTVSYIANENGFLPTGDDIAPEVLKSLEFIASNPHPINTEEST